MGNTIKHKLLKIGFLVASFSMIHVALAVENKVALVIGNAKYKDAPLKNPVNDAQDMKVALEKAGFKVIYIENANHAKMDEYRDKFIDALKDLNGQGTGLFFYAGHGVQADGTNYLIPIDAKIKTKSDLNERAYSLNLILGAMEDSENKVNIVILDACRTNPYRSFSRDGKEGLASANAPKASKGSLIAYSTASDSVADDNGKGKNGLYTKYLKQYLFQEGLTIETALKKVAEAVQDENEEQEPFYYSSIRGELCLGGCSTTPSVSAPKTTYAPLISFVSGSDSVNQNKSYSVKFKATDADGDLSKILVDWGDTQPPLQKPLKMVQH